MHMDKKDNSLQIDINNLIHLNLLMITSNMGVQLQEEVICQQMIKDNKL